MTGIELVFDEIKEPDQFVENQVATNAKGGIVTEYDLGHKNVLTQTFTGSIHKKCGPIQMLTFLRGKECDLMPLTEKNLIDYCTYAILNAEKGILYLKWNRTQGAKKTLIRMTYWSGA